jgi:hypothetical protein
VLSAFRHERKGRAKVFTAREWNIAGGGCRVFKRGAFWCKIGFMNDLPVFPIPHSGNTRVIPESRDTFSVECASISAADKDALVGFFNQMQGRFRAFRFEHGATVFAKCRFDSDEGPATVGGPGPHNIAVRIKILNST